MPENMYEDETLVCIEPGCGKEFILKEKSIKFFEEKGLTKPKRCWDCRQKRKALKEKVV